MPTSSRSNRPNPMRTRRPASCRPPKGRLTPPPTSSPASNPCRFRPVQAPCRMLIVSRLMSSSKNLPPRSTALPHRPESTNNPSTKHWRLISRSAPMAPTTPFPLPWIRRQPPHMASLACPSAPRPVPTRPQRIFLPPSIRWSTAGR